MTETVLTILKISVIVAIPSSMIVLALKAGRPYLKELFGNPKILIKYFLVMFILMPALALLFYSLDAAHHTIWMAVIVISISPPFPGMIKSISRLGGKLAYDFTSSASQAKMLFEKKEPEAIAST